MGKHEIRMRRQRMTRGSERFRNYGAILKQHDEEKKMKKITKVFTFFLLITILIILLVIVNRWEKKKIQEKPKNSASRYEVRGRILDPRSKDHAFQ